jgi:hypothetical protein
LVSQVIKAAAGLPPVAFLPKGAFAMFHSKWWPLAGAVVVAISLAAVGVGFRAANPSGTAQAAPPEKAPSELERLRQENELLKLNLQIVLEKCRSQEAELNAQRGRGPGSGPGMPGPGGPTGGGMMGSGPPTTGSGGAPGYPMGTGGTQPPPGMGSMGSAGGPPAYPGMGSPDGGGELPGAGGPPTGGYPKAVQPPGANEDFVREAEDALKALRQAKDKDAQKKAAEALDKAMKKLREQLGKEPGTK